MGKMQREKGKRFERRVAADLRAIYGKQVRRGWQARAGSADACDVEGSPWAIECKDQGSPSIWAAMVQATDGAELEEVPVAICKRPREEPLVALRYSDWLEICRALHGAGLVPRVDARNRKE